MKQILSISFAIIYLVLSAGLTINIHYCLGEVKSVTPFLSSEECCCCTIDMLLDCCGDEQVVFQFSTEDQLIVSNILDFKPLLHEIIDLSPIHLTDTDDHQKVIPSFCKSPPLDKVPIWLKLSNFTFYG